MCNAVKLTREESRIVAEALRNAKSSVGDAFFREMIPGPKDKILSRSQTEERESLLLDRMQEYENLARLFDKEA